MVPVALSDVIAVGEVPTASEIDILAKAGFRSMLNTQPDGEVARLMSSADARDLAAKAGLAYCHLPIPSRRPDEASLAAFAAALKDLPRPIYACCYSGARTAAAWALVAAPEQPAQSIIDACQTAGFDIEFLRAKLAERHAAASALKATGTAAADFVAKGPAAVDVAAMPLPALKPSILVPRAASVGGFAVAG